MRALALTLLLVAAAPSHAAADSSYIDSARHFSECAAMFEELSEEATNAGPAQKQELADTSRGAMLAGAWILFSTQAGNQPLKFFMEYMGVWKEEFKTKHQAETETAALGGQKAIEKLLVNQQSLVRLCMGMQDLQKEAIDQARKARLGQN